MSKEKYGFVYMWHDCAKSKQNGPDKIKRYYIGSHWGNEYDGYICSSKWMREAYKRRPKDFKRRILTRNIQDRKETVVKEYQWLQLIKNTELGKKYYNLANHEFNHWTTCPDSAKTIGEKISIANKGRKAWNKGITVFNGEANHFFGKTHSEETKKLMKEKKIGIKFPNRKSSPHSEEHKTNISKTLKETFAKKFPIENRYVPEFKRGSPEWIEKIKNTRKANPMMWITDGTQNKLHTKSEKIPDGWYKGRINIKLKK